MITKCVFPVAGYGTRFLPATKSTPKEMLPVVNKPLLHYAVEEACAAGIQDMIMVTSRGKHSIQDYFDVSYELDSHIAGTPAEKSLYSIRGLLKNCTFSYTRQNEIKGLGHAVFSARHLLDSQPFAVTLADDLCITPKNSPGILSSLQQLHQEHGCSVVALAEVDDEKVSRYGVIRGKQLSDRVWKIEDMVEKPTLKEAPSRLAVVGRYLLTSDLLELLGQTEAGRNNEIQITDALKQKAQKGEMLGYLFDGQWFDCGSVKGFVAATNHVYSNLSTD